jgi:hypothetical protein
MQLRNEQSGLRPSHGLDCADQFQLPCPEFKNIHRTASGDDIGQMRFLVIEEIIGACAGWDE